MESLKRLVPYLKKYRGVIILTLVMGSILGLIPLASAKLLKIIIDDGFGKKDPQVLTYAPLAIVGIYIVGGILRFLHMYLSRYTGEQIGFDIRQDLQSHYAQMNLDFHTSNSSSGLLSKTINDVIAIQQGLPLLADIVREPLSALAMLGYLFYTDWQLTAIAMIVAPVLILGSRSLGRSVRKYSHIQQEIWENVILVIKETLDGIRVVKAFGLENHMRQKFDKVMHEMLAIRKKILKREELAGPVFELLAAAILAGILFFVGHQVIAGKSSSGAFLSFVFVLIALQTPIKKLQDAHVRTQHTVASTQRIFEILDTPVTVMDPEHLGKVSKPWKVDWQSIEFKNVHFQYGPKEVLKGVNVKINRGEVVALVGSSGGGKTTMVNLLPRFYDVSAGQILIDGSDIRDFKVSDLRSHIALVTQDVFLFNESIRENILAGQIFNGKENIHQSLVVANATFVEEMKDQDQAVVGDRGTLLSGGERQRISIARAVYKNTPILILDEATSSLDSESEKIVQEALEKLMTGRTTFVIAHRLSTIQKADRILVLSDGKIIEEGRHEDLLGRQGAYFNFHRHQFG